MSTRTLNVSNVEVSGIIWIVGGFWYVLCESVAAFGFPGYSYQHNYISDLGVPGIGILQGRHLNSHLADVMNAGFVGQGLAFILSATLLYSASTALRDRGSFLAVSILHGFGIALAGLVRGSDPDCISRFGVFHVAGALMAILGGNVVLVLLGLRVLHDLIPILAQRTIATLGVLGLVSLALLILRSLHMPLLFDDGFWERGSPGKGGG